MNWTTLDASDKAVSGSDVSDSNPYMIKPINLVLVLERSPMTRSFPRVIYVLP